jgi:subtilisin family serine protease
MSAHRWVSLALVAAVVATACVPLPSRDSSPIRGARRDTVIERHTASIALDRITKRTPILNGLDRHAGVGRGVAIYVFDGGVDANHPELAGRVRIGFDAFPSMPRICNPHGTAVAGAAAGAALGVAPAAEIIDVKIIKCSNERGSLAAVRAAAEWVVNDHRQHPNHPAIANWSFIVDTSRIIPAIDSAIEVLHDAGILVVASAGNVDIDACRVSPANSRLALVVGASAMERRPNDDWRDVRAKGTAWGRCIDIYAPGESVLLPDAHGSSGTTGLWNGTSMAAGYVSGAAAILLEQHRRAGPDAVANILRERATTAVEERAAGPSTRLAPLLYIGLH